MRDWHTTPDANERDGRRWHALYTRHQHEKSVAQSLAEKGFEVFLPLYRARRQWKDRVKELSLPLFPCYVFLKSWELERRLDIITTPGVHMLLTVAGRPAVIETQEIEAVRRVVKSTLQSEPHPFLNCGDWIRVKSGPLIGVEGILVRKKNSTRLVLSVSLLEKSVAVEVDAFLVERARRPSCAPLAAQASFGPFGSSSKNAAQLRYGTN